MNFQKGKADKPLSVQGQTAVVTGGGRGIGRAIAQSLATAGASVAVIARSKNELDETVRLIGQGSNSRALALVADVTEAAAVATAIRQAERELGPIDTLINNAGSVKPFGPFWETPVEQWWRTMEVNLLGVALCTHAVLPGMVARGRGRIVNVSSGAGAVAAPYFSSYVISKTALIRFTECLAMEAGPRGVSAFAISPGTVRTAMAEYSLYSEEGKKWLPWFKRIFDEGMNVTAERPAELVLQLLSGRYDFLSGKMVSIYEDLETLKATAAEMEQQNLYTLKMETLKPAPGTPAIGSVLSEARKQANK
ncbi:MAG TPA: SDR family oxidoreductase [Candidatus Angelobacter sp.]|nr:SDR family oxidoreductase [Candidatus Angelobacter sp.]